MTEKDFSVEESRFIDKYLKCSKVLREAERQLRLKSFEEFDERIERAKQVKESMQKMVEE